MITIISYQPRWPTQFVSLSDRLRDVLGNLALRIDHIGSTAVPGLAAKDIIDIQVTVAELAEPVEIALNEAQYQRVGRIERDHVPPGASADPVEWRKWFFKPAPTLPAAHPQVHLHVRAAGCANQRYALLFRDYLRANREVATAYAHAKNAIANYHADDIEAYCDIKDPVCDIIMCGAEAWAERIHWEVGPADRQAFGG
jgi:GrpB-like predicted nucleotidyltransferase (UPF0157 family)